MRIVNRSEFLAIDGEAVYAKYEPQFCSELAIKVGNAGSNDFVCQYLSPDLAIDNSSDVDCSEKFHEMESDSSVDNPVDLYFYGRDGYYDNDQLFVVLSKDDLRAYIKRLTETMDKMV